MKKTYVQPEIIIEQLFDEQIIATSGVMSVNNGVNIGYGGIDEDGGLEADVKGEGDFDFSWD